MHRLFGVAGIDCMLVRQAKGGVETRHPARAAFVTERSGVLSRAGPGPGTMHVRFGDVLVSWKNAGGGVQGMRSPAGTDAGVRLSVDSLPCGQRLVPFTGGSMIAALAAMDGASPNEHVSRAREGILFTLGMIAMDPDADRFGPENVGHAFQAHMGRGGPIPSLPVGAVPFGVKSTVDLLRTRISLLCRAHPDGIRASGRIEDVLEMAGLSHLSDAHISQPSVRAAILGNAGLVRDVFGRLCVTPPDDIFVAQVTADELRRLKGMLRSGRLPGTWASAMARDVERHAGGGRYEVSAFTSRGVDLMVMESSVDPGAPAQIVAWRSVDRVPVVTGPSGPQVLVASSEIPDEDDVARLKIVLAAMVKPVPPAAPGDGSFDAGATSGARESA